jgi:hypothetical protein
MSMMKEIRTKLILEGLFSKSPEKYSPVLFSISIVKRKNESFKLKKFRRLMSVGLIKAALLFVITNTFENLLC